MLNVPPVASRGEIEVSRPANLRLNLEPRGDDLGAKAASLRRVTQPGCAKARALENERGQLIERVAELQAHQDERCDHQIKAGVHGELENQMLLVARADSRLAINQTQNASKRRASDEIFVGQKTEGFRRRGSDALVANLS